MKTMEKHMLKIVIFAIPGNENIALSSERPAVCDWRARAPARAGYTEFGDPKSIMAKFHFSRSKKP